MPMMDDYCMVALGKSCLMEVADGPSEVQRCQLPQVEWHENRGSTSAEATHHTAQGEKPQWNGRCRSGHGHVVGQREDKPRDDEKE